MKTGDKVRFLNTVGGGVIVGFPDKLTVSVRDETGFDIPVLRSEVVVIEAAADEAEKGADGHPQNINKMEVLHRTETTATKRVEIREEGEVLNLYMAYVRKSSPNDGQQKFEAYLINDSNYDVHFILAEQDAAGAFVRHADRIEPDTKLFLESFTEKEIAAHERLLLQALFFKTEVSFTVKPPLLVEVKTEGSKFFKHNTFKENEFFNEPAMVVPLIENDVPLKPVNIDVAAIQAKWEGEALPTLATPKRRPARESQTTDGPLEVDLHAASLLDTVQGMSAKDILDYQIKVFHDVMQQHKKHKGKRIVFIHGKGNGVLRKEIERLLRQQYKGCRYQDANFCEYGFGATLVFIG